jgi:hypothetical protein
LLPELMLLSRLLQLQLFSLLQPPAGVRRAVADAANASSEEKDCYVARFIT